MKKWRADEIGSGVEREYGVSVYLAAEVDTRIAEMRKAFEVSSTDEENRLRARVAELEKVLRPIVGSAAPASHHANYCVVHRQFLGEARKALGL